MNQSLAICASFTLGVSALLAQSPQAPAAAVVSSQTNQHARVFNRSDMFKKYDKDGDGKLNDAERQAMFADRKAALEKQHRELEKKFDKNGDGKLDDQERAEMRAEMQKRYPAASSKMREQLLKRFDKNGDGKLDEEERKTMRETMISERQKFTAMRNATNTVGKTAAPAAAK